MPPLHVVVAIPFPARVVEPPRVPRPGLVVANTPVRPVGTRETGAVPRPVEGVFLRRRPYATSAMRPKRPTFAVTRAVDTRRVGQAAPSPTPSKAALLQGVVGAARDAPDGVGVGPVVLVLVTVAGPSGLRRPRSPGLADTGPPRPFVDAGGVRGVARHRDDGREGVAQVGPGGEVATHEPFRRP